MIKIGLILLVLSGINGFVLQNSDLFFEKHKKKKKIEIILFITTLTFAFIGCCCLF